MKHPLFRIGQAVTPNVKESAWERVDGNENFIRPKFGEIYHVEAYVDCVDNIWYISLSELNPNEYYDDTGFSPVVSDSVLESELENISTVQIDRKQMKNAELIPAKN